jgi:hypothetical protein
MPSSCNDQLLIVLFSIYAQADAVNQGALSLDFAAIIGSIPVAEFEATLRDEPSNVLPFLSLAAHQVQNYPTICCVCFSLE